MKNSIQAVFVIIIMSVAYWACIDEIQFDIDSQQPSVVVEGLISTAMKTYRIKVNESTLLGQGIDNIKTPISGATVQVINGQGNAVSFIEDPEELGTYKADMQGVVGESYYTEVTLPNGDLIASNPETILAPVLIDSIPIRIDEVTGLNASGNSEITAFVVAGVNVNLDPNDRPFLRWRVDGEYEFQELYPMAFSPRRCYIKDFIDFNNLAFEDGNDIEGNQIINKDIIRVNLNRRFHVIYGFMVTQYRISEKEHSYWKQVDQLINIDGTIFDPPPATIVGNLSNRTNPEEQVQGYFSVVSQDFKRAFVETGDLGYFVQTNCTSLSFRTNPPECEDCTLIPNSSLDKPTYWPF